MPKITSAKSKLKPESSLTPLIEDFFHQLGFTGATINITQDQDNLNVHLEVAPEDSGILIGYNGETISSLQLFLSLLVHHHLGVWHRLILNVNDYREKRHLSLEEMAQAAAQRVKSTGQEVVMPPLPSFDRRLIHMALSDNPEVVTESIGEGKDRRLVISPKNPSTS